ncbi:hypothetical protein EHQ97_15605 [Leptospira adleri]|nr:hypothetical protein EHQ97_15605 [Leptospira adleri]
MGGGRHRATFLYHKIIILQVKCLLVGTPTNQPIANVLIPNRVQLERKVLQSDPHPFLNFSKKSIFLSLHRKIPRSSDKRNPERETTYLFSRNLRNILR